LSEEFDERRYGKHLREHERDARPFQEIGLVRISAQRDRPFRMIVTDHFGGT
jgi:hypothetical protein